MIGVFGINIGEFLIGAGVIGFAVGTIGVWLINRVKDGKLRKLGFAHGKATSVFGSHKVPGWGKLENAIQHKAAVYMMAYKRGLDDDDKLIKEIETAE